MKLLHINIAIAALLGVSFTSYLFLHVTTTQRSRYRRTGQPQSAQALPCDSYVLGTEYGQHSS